jgi:hypothetical protein
MASPDPAVYVWVRTTVDWADESGPHGRVKDEFRQRVDLWNGTFTLSYHAFRHEVARIARDNLACVRRAALAAWDDIPDGAVVLPVDDDDWFAPDIADALEERLDPGAIGCRWQAAYVEVPFGPGHAVHRLRMRLLPWTSPRWVCSTNNYALVKGPDSEEVARRHVHASRVYRAERERVRVLSGCLSLTNRTLASQTTLQFRRPAITKARLVRAYHAYRRLYRSRRVPRLDWAAEYVERMAVLMDGLRLREEARSA